MYVMWLGSLRTHKNAGKLDDRKIRWCAGCGKVENATRIYANSNASASAGGSAAGTTDKQKKVEEERE
eukprot:COSAG04_NODE_30738_length_261_cov_0.623457_1_plen_67_part_10